MESVGVSVAGWARSHRAGAMIRRAGGGGRFQRMASSPGAAVALLRMNADIDVRGVLSAISAPTLILHRREEVISAVEHGRCLVEHIPGARLVEFEGTDHWPWVGETTPIVKEIEEFLTGTPEPERALATVLFTDIVGSTERAVQVGDKAWRDLLPRHDAMVGYALPRHRGREVKTTGDGYLVTFDRPARAIRCACAIRANALDLGLDVRAGLHTGECELRARTLAASACTSAPEWRRGTTRTTFPQSVLEMRERSSGSPTGSLPA
jgi:hypothetical protein